MGHIIRWATIFLVALTSYSSAFSQILTPVKWSFSTEAVSETEFDLVFKCDINKGWTVYSQYLESEDGPVATYIEYEDKGSAELVGKSVESGNKKDGFDKIFDMNVTKFLSGKPYEIRQRVKITEPATISGYLEFMCCDAEKCLPPDDVDFSFDLVPGAAKTAVDESPKVAESTKVSSTPTPAQVVEVQTPKSAEQGTSKVSESVENLQSQASAGKKTIADAIDKGASEIVAVPADASKVSSVMKEAGYNAHPNLEDSPIEWKSKLTKLSDDEYELSFVADIQDKWQLYSHYTADGGPLPVIIEIEGGADLSNAPDPIETGNRFEGKDPLFENINVIKFKSGKPYTFTQKFNSQEGVQEIVGYLTYQCCDDEICKPPTDVEFTYNLNSLALTSTGLASIDDSSAASLANIDGNVIDQQRPELQSSYKTPIGDCGDVEEEATSFWAIFFGGFLGGLAAILLPCIFPMIPITVSFFTKDTKRKGWVNGLIYGASIIIIFVSIGLAVTALLGPEALNRLSTNWIANTFFFFVFVAFAFSFFGFYEIALPSSWSTKSDAMADKGGLIGIFFMAATLAIVSFSCTGPIIGTALVQVAANGNYIGPFAVMFGFSAALALPFGLFAAFPAWLNSLPRSGGWMVSVKVMLGFLELALALKFLSIADMTNHWGFLRYELYLGACVIIALLMVAYLMGYIRFPKEPKLTSLSLPRKGFALACLGLAVYLASGFRVNPETESYTSLNLMSGLAPPTNYNFFLEPGSLDPNIKAKYPSFSKCANNIDCFKDYYEGLAYAKEVGKPVLLDHTGHGCVNCRRTEELIWVDDDVRKTLRDEYVMVALYVDDDKKLDETLISKTRNKKLRNVGNKWADFQIVNFNQNSQPLYILMTPEEQVLAAPRPYQAGVDSYLDFLNCGLNTFQRTKDVGMLDN